MSEKTIVPAKTEVANGRRWDPFEHLNQVQAEFDRLLDDRFAPFRSLRRNAEPMGAWAPRVDVFERDGKLVVKAELPGIKKDDIEVKVEDGDLVVRGQRSSEKKVEEKDYYRMERSYGTFYRRMPLPNGVAEDQIKATYNDGVLELTMPKPAASESKAKKIAIN